MAALVDAFAMLAIWTTWNNETRAGSKNLSKVPYAIDGRRAKSDDPSTWMTYFEAEECRAARGHGGVNIMLTGVADGLALGGIDLDACLGEEGDLAPWAADIVAKLDSYTEVSPSGTGLKIFFRHDPAITLDPKHRWTKHVQKPNPNGKDFGIEQYLEKHFLAVTEIVYQGYTTLRTIGLDVLYAVRVAMARFKDEPKVAVSDAERLQSAIDALPNNDLSWLDWNTRGMAIYAATGGTGYDAFLRWSRKSSKFDERNSRERWDNWRRSPPDQVGEGTIFHHALDAGWQDPNRGVKPNGHARTNGSRHPYAPSDDEDDDINVGLIGKRRQPIFRIVEGDVARWHGVEVPEVDMLIDNMLPLHVAGILAGDGGAGKSLLSQVLCTCVATGFAFCGRRVERGKAVYITGEDPETVLHNRQARINDSLGYTMEKLGGRLYLRSILDDDIFLFVEGRPSGLLGELRDELEAMDGVKLVIIDSAAIVYDDDEIKRRPVAKFMISLNRLARRLKATVLLITHKSRSGGSGAGSFTSGSTGWAAHARCGFDIVPSNDDNDAGDVILKLVKPNYTAPIDPISLRWDRHGVLTFVPSKPTDQLELAVQRKGEKDDDHTLMRTIDAQWHRGNAFMKKSDPMLPQAMARDPHKWSVKKTNGVVSRCVLSGWIFYTDSGARRGWKVTDLGRTEIGGTHNI